MSAIIDCSFSTEIINMIMKTESKPFRPSLKENGADVDGRLMDLMTEGWAEDPNQRPTINAVRGLLIAINNGR